MSIATYKSAVDALATALETARLANETVRAEYAALGGTEGGSPAIVNGQRLPDLRFTPLVSDMLAAWLQRRADAAEFLNE